MAAINTETTSALLKGIALMAKDLVADPVLRDEIIEETRQVRPLIQKHNELNVHGSDEKEILSLNLVFMNLSALVGRLSEDNAVESLVAMGIHNLVSYAYLVATDDGTGDSVDSIESLQEQMERYTAATGRAPQTEHTE